MKTSLIRYRVADFLKPYPPFQFIANEDLLALAGNGRVQFHETEEFVYRKGQRRGAFIWVIQQGQVELLHELSEGDALCDILAAGDLLGVEGLLGSSVYLHSARTAGDVILYALDAKAFEGLIRNCPPASRYLAAHFSVHARYMADAAAAAGSNGPAPLRVPSSRLPMELPLTPVRRRLPTCPPDLSIREASKRMATSGADVIAVIDPGGKPLGAVTSRAFCERVATGEMGVDESVRNVMGEMATAPPGLAAGDYLIAMLRHGCRYLGITPDGTPNQPLEAMVTDTDLRLHSHDPLTLTWEMARAETLGELGALRHSVTDLIAEQTNAPAVLDWLSGCSGQMNLVLARQLLKVVLREMEPGRPGAPPLDYCWIFLGEAGRGELLLPVLPLNGIVYADPPADSEAAAGEFFLDLLQRVTLAMEACGLRFPAEGAQAGPPRLCYSLSAWKQLFRDLVRDPVRSGIYEARLLFDFAAVEGNLSLASELQREIETELAANPSFIGVLVNDSMDNLPPLTLLDDLVVEIDGARKDKLDLGRTILNPVVDVGRALSLARHKTGASSSIERLRDAASALPGHEALFAEAAEAFRVARFHQTITGLRENSDGLLLDPSGVSKTERQFLKAAFRSIFRLLEFTAGNYRSFAGL